MEHQLEEQIPEMAERDIYGSFSLADVEFALSVKSIQEVINEPESYSPMPLAPDYLLGLFNLRGVIIPVVDLRKIFDFSVDIDENNKERKIAIIEHGNFCVGLLFDATGEVFNGNEQQRNHFHSNSEDPNKAVIEGVFKLDEGKRVVQILNPYKVLNLNQIPRSADSSASNVRRISKREQCISFMVGTSLCAIDIDAIQEIVDIKEVQNYALASDICLGSVNVRGNTVPIIDFSHFLGYGKTQPSSDGTHDNKMIIMKINDEYFGLLVKSIENIISYFKEDLIEFPVLSEKTKDLFKGCISSSDREIQTILLNHETILSNDEIASVIGGHKRLYKEKAKNIEEEIAGTSEQKSYITFTLNNNYALEINEVKEVIDYPESLIRPPNISAYFKGMINLRGELVAVIDPRALYGMDDEPSSSAPKILIFKSGDAKYGLMVDSVDSIVSFSEKDKVNIPKSLYQNGGQSLAEDIKDAVHVKTKADGEKTLLILSLSSLYLRVNPDS